MLPSPLNSQYREIRAVRGASVYNVTKISRDIDEKAAYDSYINLEPGIQSDPGDSSDAP